MQKDKATLELLSIREVSRLLNCHPNTLRTWDNTGILKAVRIGVRGARKYKKADIDKLVNTSPYFQSMTKNTDENLLLFREIAEAVPAMVAVYNIHTGEYIYVNRAIKQLLGYEASDFVMNGITFVTSLVHPDDLTRITEENKKALQMASRNKSSIDGDPIITFEYRMKHKDGSWCWLHTDGSVFARDKKGSIVSVLNVSLDITARKEMEDELIHLATTLERRVKERTEELEESKRRYQTFLSQSSEGIWRFELEKPLPIKLSAERQISHCYKYAYLAECNDAMAKMYGFQYAREIVGARLADFMPKSDAVNIKYLTAFISSGYQIADEESHEKDKYGKEHYMQNSLTGVIENGHVVRAWGMQRDITERKKLEQKKDDFTALVSHELKTPITSLKMFVQVMLRTVKKKNDSEMERQLGVMDRQINKLTGLINGLLDLSRVQERKLTYKKQNFALGIFAKEVAKNLQQIIHSHVIVVKVNSKRKIIADKEHVGQVLTNLINNAVKYSPGADKVIVTIQDKEKNIIVGVEDFGIGVPEDEREKIFDRFFQVGTLKNSSTGLGLGLYISKEIVESHNGRIWVEGKKTGKGSIFYFSLLSK